MSKFNAWTMYIYLDRQSLSWIVKNTNNILFAIIALVAFLLALLLMFMWLLVVTNDVTTVLFFFVRPKGEVFQKSKERSRLGALKTGALSCIPSESLKDTNKMRALPTIPGTSRDYRFLYSAFCLLSTIKTARPHSCRVGWKYFATLSSMRLINTLLGNNRGRVHWAGGEI